MWISASLTWVEKELQAVGVTPQQFEMVALKVASDLIGGKGKEQVLADVLSLFRTVQLPG